LPSADLAVLCRSRLAGEGGLAYNIDGGWPGAFAGKPAPTSERRRMKISSSPKIHCRSEPARENGLAFNIDAGWSDAFAGKPGSYRVQG
jgi:hypothetical protein